MSGCGAVEARERFLKAFIEELGNLRVLTVGLSKLAAEGAAAKALSGVGAIGDPPSAVKELLAALGVGAEVSAGADELEVRVTAPCPFSLSGCSQLCPLPHVAAVHLSSRGERWSPRRVGQLFVKAGEGGCSFTLVRVPRKLEEGDGGG